MYIVCPKFNEYIYRVNLSLVHYSYISVLSFISFNLRRNTCNIKMGKKMRKEYAMLLQDLLKKNIGI